MPSEAAAPRLIWYEGRWQELMPVVPDHVLEQRHRLKRVWNGKTLMCETVSPAAPAPDPAPSSHPER